MIIDNYEAKIWLGRRSGYTDNYYNVSEIEKVISEWCTAKGQCVSITPTKFIYVKSDESGTGEEPGLIIGFINYPRYPQSEAEIRKRARELGQLLMEKFNQYRVSITFYPSVPNGTVMLENDNLT